MKLSVIFCTALLFQVSFGQIAWDSNCGVTKGCFPDCYGGCEYLVTWVPGASGVTFTIQVAESDSNVYASIGFSDDLRMGDDSTVSCLVPDASLDTGYTDGLGYESLGTLGLSSTSVSQSGGVITCSFVRSFSESNSKYFNLNDDYILMLVIGIAKLENGVYRVDHHEKIPWNSDKEVDFNSLEIVGLYKLNSPRVKLHGIMMVLAWLMMSLVGMMTARYNKDMLPEKTLFGAKIWFQLHRGCMVLVVVFLIIGFIPIWVELEGYSQILSPAITKIHPIFGITVTILAFVNPIMGILRPGPDHKRRWIFNWAHLGLGYGTQILAVVVIFLGYALERSVLPSSIFIVTVFQLFVIVAVVIFLEIFQFRQKQQTIDSAEETKKSTLNGTTTFEITGKAEIKSPTKLPMYVLSVFSILNFGFALAALAMIAAS